MASFVAPGIWQSEELRLLLRPNQFGSDPRYLTCPSFPAWNRPYSRSEVIHRAGDESIFPAFERERPRIVNNFAASASSGYELSSFLEKMNWTRLSNLAVVLGSGNEYSDEDESSLETITSGYKEFASGSGRANDHYPPLEYE